LLFDSDGYNKPVIQMDLGDAELHIRDSRLRLQLPPFGEHFGHDVCCDDLSYARSESKLSMACSARRVDHAIVRLNLGELEKSI
jgi:hypothetical protein